MIAAMHDTGLENEQRAARKRTRAGHFTNSYQYNNRSLQYQKIPSSAQETALLTSGTAHSDRMLFIARLPISSVLILFCDLAAVAKGVSVLQSLRSRKFFGLTCRQTLTDC